MDTESYWFISYWKQGLGENSFGSSVCKCIHPSVIMKRKNNATNVYQYHIMHYKRISKEEYDLFLES